MICLKRTEETMVFDQTILVGQVTEVREDDREGYREDAIKIIDKLSKDMKPLGIEWTLVEALKLLQAGYCGKHNTHVRRPLPTLEEVEAGLK